MKSSTPILIPLLIAVLFGIIVSLALVFSANAQTPLHNPGYANEVNVGAQAAGTVAGTIILQDGSSAPFTGQIVLPTPSPTPTPVPSSCISLVSPPPPSVTGTIALPTSDNCQTFGLKAWFEHLTIDGQPAGDFDLGKVQWNTVGTNPGPHVAVISSQSRNPSTQALGAVAVVLTVAAPAPTPSPTATATPAGFIHDPLRPDNDAANNTVPSAAFMATYRAAVANGQGCPGNGHPCEIQPAIMQTIDPSFVGTTDQELVHGAAMCGIDPDWVRADAVWESQWHQSGIGDVGHGPSNGILQCKAPDYPASCPSAAGDRTVTDMSVINRDVNQPDCMSYLSTMFNIEFRMADWCNAKNGGAQAYIEDGRDHPGNGLLPYPQAVAAHDPAYDKYFMAIWGPGDWGSSGFWAYVNGVQKIYDAKPWLQPNFLHFGFKQAPARAIHMNDARRPRR